MQPLVIKEAQHRWYLVCWDTQKKELRNFGLDRISKFEICYKKGENLTINIKDIYSNSIGIETYEPATVVQIKTNSYQAKYLKSLPIHPSQKIHKETKENCWLELFVHPTNEFIMTLFKYNSSIEVIKPKWLRTEMKNRTTEMLEKYS